MNEGSILVTRGKSAIRGLKLLLLNLNSLEQRVKIHLSRLKEEDSISSLTSNTYEDIVERCNSLQEEAINAVEEWQDIIPEAKIKTQIGIISNLKTEKNYLEGEIQDLRHDLETTRSKTSDKNDELVKQLGKKESELKEVKAKLRKKQNELDSSFYTGISGSPDLSLGGIGSAAVGGSNPLYFQAPRNFKCKNCNHEFSSIHDSLVYLTPQCPSCGGYDVVRAD